jgi:hypothetical protein
VLSHIVQKETPTNYEGAIAAGSNKAIITYFEACWITSYSTAYPADSAIVTEELEIVTSDVFDNFSPYAANYNLLETDNTVTSLDTAAAVKRSIRFANTSALGSSGGGSGPFGA